MQKWLRTSSIGIDYPKIFTKENKTIRRRDRDIERKSETVCVCL